MGGPASDRGRRCWPGCSGWPWRPALFAATVELGGALGLALLLAARAAQGAAAALTWTAGLALIAITNPPERRGAVLGLALSASGIGVLLGPLLTGVLADLYGLRAPFLLIAVLAAADAVARIVLIKQLPVRPNPTPLRALARGPQAGLLIALTAVGAAATAFAEPVLPLHLAGLGLGPSGIGLAFGAAALGGALRRSAGRAGHRPVRPRAGWPRPARWSPRPASCCAGCPRPAGRSFCLVLVGAGSRAVLQTTLVLIGVLAEHIQSPAYGTAYALYNLAYTAGLCVAPIVAGTVAGLAGVPAAMGLAAAGVVLIMVVLLLRARPGRTVPASS